MRCLANPEYIFLVFVRPFCEVGSRCFLHCPRVSELVCGMSHSTSGANSGMVRYYLLKTDEAVQVAENLLEVQYIDLAVSQERAFAENR